MKATGALFRRLMPVLLAGLAFVVLVPTWGQVSNALQPVTVLDTPPLEDSDLDGNGIIDHRDFLLLISVWHGLATPLPSATPTPTQMPTATPSPTPDYVIDGFWVGNFTEYFSDTQNHAVSRTGQFLWHLKSDGSQVTGTGDDTQYPLTINATFDKGLLRGTLKSSMNFTVWGVQDIPQSATAGYVPKFEGFMWGSKDGLNYDATFSVTRTTIRPTLAPTVTPTPTRSATHPPAQTSTPTRTPTATDTSTPWF